jgi:hypothetical protein
MYFFHGILMPRCTLLQHCSNLLLYSSNVLGFCLGLGGNSFLKWLKVFGGGWPGSQSMLYEWAVIILNKLFFTIALFYSSYHLTYSNVCINVVSLHILSIALIFSLNPLIKLEKYWDSGSEGFNAFIKDLISSNL